MANLRRPLFGLLACTVLAGCGSSSAAPTAEQVTAATHALQPALQALSIAANSEWHQGSAKLELTISDDNQVLRCVASRHEGKLYGHTHGTSTPAMVAVLQRTCGELLFAPFPAAFFAGKPSVQVMAPVGFSGDLNPALRLRFETSTFMSFKQQQFFWDAVMQDRTITRIGTAHFFYQANAQGQVQGCTVHLAARPERPEAFSNSRNFARTLTGRCQRLNLAAMPGFAVGADGLARGHVAVLYTPWRQALTVSPAD